MGRKSLIVDGMKLCRQCNQILSIDNFSPAGTSRTGLRTYKADCKNCSRIIDRAKRQQDPKYNAMRNSQHLKRKSDENYRLKELAQQRLRRKMNPELQSAHVAKRRAARLGTLTEYDLELSVSYRKAIASDPCFYCGITDAENYHVDHFFPIAKGGDDRWSNLVRACEYCNLSKNAKCGTYALLKIGES